MKFQFNWTEFLNQPAISNEKWREALICACGWIDCPVGQLDVEKDWRGQPTDQKLYNLGLDFYQPIKDKDISKAQNILDKINKRAENLNKQ